MSTVLTSGALCDAIEGVTAVTTASHALGYLNKGYRKFLSGLHPDLSKPAHAWSFLRNVKPITVGGAVTGTATGTVAGLTTATTSIFDPGMVGATITISDTATRTATVTSFVSATIIYTDDTTGFTSKSISVDRCGMKALPSDFGGSIYRLTYSPDSGRDAYTLFQRDPREIMQAWLPTPTEGDPTYYALVSGLFASTADQPWAIMYTPVPDESRILVCDYAIEPAVLTDSGSEYPLGGPKHSQTILACALAEWERVSGRVAGYWENEANRMMVMSINADKAFYAGGGGPVVPLGEVIVPGIDRPRSVPEVQWPITT